MEIFIVFKFGEYYMLFLDDGYGEYVYEVMRFLKVCEFIESLLYLSVRNC